MLDKKAGKLIASLAGVAGSVATIASILAKIFNWEINSATMIVAVVALSFFAVGYIVDRLVDKVNREINAKIGEIEKIVKDEQERAIVRDKEQAKAICRLELAMMMSNQPDNKVAIEKKARYYFCELGGNDWMGQAYSDWAMEHNGDIGALLHERSKM